MATIDSMFELAIELRDNGALRDSINVFNKILIAYPDYKEVHGVYSVLAGVHMDLGEHDQALVYFKKGTELLPKSERASLGFYTILVELRRDDDAIHELSRYLNANPARLYKDTLEELLEDLEKGYMTNHEKDIRHFAKVNRLRFDCENPTAAKKSYKSLPGLL